SRKVRNGADCPALLRCLIPPSGSVTILVFSYRHGTGDERRRNSSLAAAALSAAASARRLMSRCRPLDVAIVAGHGVRCAGGPVVRWAQSVRTGLSLGRNDHRPLLGRYRLLQGPTHELADHRQHRRLADGRRTGRAVSSVRGLETARPVFRSAQTLTTE